jgi:hypothetical protein
MSHKKISKKGKGSYAKYRVTNTFSKNKKCKLLRHLKLFDKDEVAKRCLETGLKQGFEWKRKIPRTPIWNHVDKKHAELWKSLGHSGKDFLEHSKRSKKLVTPLKKSIGGSGA